MLLSQTITKLTSYFILEFNIVNLQKKYDKCAVIPFKIFVELTNTEIYSKIIIIKETEFHLIIKWIVSNYLTI